MPERLEFLVEVAPNGEGFTHIPALPGLCFRAEDASRLRSIATAKVLDYLLWLDKHGLGGINPCAASLLELAANGQAGEFDLVESERQAGAEVWVSGNPAALFRSDRRCMSDEEVRMHFRFARAVIDEMRTLVSPLAPSQMSWKPAPGRRSINDTLSHLGNCVWWYCSRIDDDLPEPEEVENEESTDRVTRLLTSGLGFMLSFPETRRTEIHVPKRFLTAKPDEPWTHTKACRRQAEHLWEHLGSLVTAVSLAASV